MKILKLSLLAFLFLSAAGAGNSKVLACSCGEVSACEAFNRAHAVFIGRPIKASKQEERNYGRGTYVEYFGDVTMEVLEPFSGVSGPTVTVSASGGGMCFDYSFQPGKVYLVYARETEDKRLIAGGCSRTRQLGEISYDESDSTSYKKYILEKQKEYAEEIVFLRNIAQEKIRGARISGAVEASRDYLRKDERSYSKPIPDAKIEIKTEGYSTTLHADSSGQYSIEGLKPGAYSMTLVVPDGYEAERETDLKKEVTLRNCGCGVVNFHLMPDTTVRGKVLDQDGKPVVGIRMNLISADWQELSTDELNIPSYKVRDSVSEKDGEYVFKNVAAGRYLIGVSVINPDPKFPFQRMFYPSTPDIKKSEPIEIELGRKAGPFELRLSRKVKTHSIEGIVLWQDETPAVGASVRMNFPGDYQSQDETDTDDKGHFRLKALKDRDYEITVYWHNDEGVSGKIKSSPLGWENATSESERMTVTKDIKGLKFVLTKRER